MRVLAAAEIDEVLDFPGLIEALREAFRSDVETPLRHHHTIARPDADATLLLMPAWTGPSVAAGGHVGVKVVSVFPANGGKGLPSVMGAYLLLCGETGRPLAVMDGQALTLWRTAAASALAASCVAAPGASRMLMVGTGALAPYLVAAHRAVRPITDVAVWGRDTAKAEALAARLRADGIAAAAVADLEPAARAADIISCATLSKSPLVMGDWLKPGAHLDLVGAFRPDMRESDDAAVSRASIFVDTRAGALTEGGDLADPLARGIIGADAVRADLFDLVAGRHAGRGDAGEITLFKSVGTAIEDLAAARLVWSRLAG
ncbi:MAG: ornithine cyclodeaminase family protein [Hyphomicrobiales bacterium]